MKNAKLLGPYIWCLHGNVCEKLKAEQRNSLFIEMPVNLLVDSVFRIKINKVPERNAV